MERWKRPEMALVVGEHDSTTLDPLPTWAGPIVAEGPAEAGRWTVQYAHDEIIVTMEFDHISSGRVIRSDRYVAGKEFPEQYAELLLDEWRREQQERPEWTAYCTSCKGALETCANGRLVEAAARIHAERTGHQVIVGQEIFGRGYGVTVEVLPRDTVEVAFDGLHGTIRRDGRYDVAEWTVSERTDNKPGLYVRLFLDDGSIVEQERPEMDPRTAVETLWKHLSDS